MHRFASSDSSPAVDPASREAYLNPCQTAGWPLPAPARGPGEESPGSMEARCRVTPGGGDPRDSATENRPPALRERSWPPARVKRCGKSAPRPRRRGRHGKPHREQDQIGAARGIGRRRPSPKRASAPPPGSVARGAGRPASQRNGHPSPSRGRTEPGLQAVWRSEDRCQKTEVRIVS